MADPSPHTDDAPGTPRWVKVFGIAGIVLALLVVVMLLVGGPGDHGPGRHLGGDGADRSASPTDSRGTAPSGEPTEGHTGPPPGVDHDSRQP
jgi:hypothetical protein